MERDETIISNQKEYISQYEKTIFFLLNKSVREKIRQLNNRTNTLTKEESIVENAKIIREIENDYLLRIFEDFKFRIKEIIFHIQNRIKVKGSIDNCYLVVACIVKNESNYIREWIEFYIKSGVDKILIFDNGSTDNLKDVVQENQFIGKVEYFNYPGNKAQLFAYNDALKLVRNKTKWLALIDADEFLFSPNGKTLKSNLKDFEKYGGVGVNWVVYGPCGFENKPEGNVVENYLYTFVDKNNELNCRVKSIVQPLKVRHPVSPHFCAYVKNYYCVDENYSPISGLGMYGKGTGACTYLNSVNTFRINHYWTKSKEELKRKCQRGYPDGTKNPQYDDILKRLDYPLERDCSILDYIKSLD